MTKKNVVVSTTVTTDDSMLASKYGNFEHFEYSINTWKYVCEKHGWEFIRYTTPSIADVNTHRVTWQRWFDVFDLLESNNIDYNQILMVDGSIMARWDYPDIFELSDNKWMAYREMYNFKWLYDSIEGYRPLFPGVDFIHKDYFNCGFVMFNEKHKPFIESIKKFYFDNVDEVLDYQRNKVKKSTDQTPINWLLTKHKVDVKELNKAYLISHIQRLDLFHHNWQLKEDTTPFFIKYFYGWMFSGLADKGNFRNKMMKQTWDLIKHKYV